MGVLVAILAGGGVFLPVEIELSLTVSSSPAAKRDRVQS